MTTYPDQIPVNEVVNALAKSIDILTQPEEPKPETFNAEVIDVTPAQQQIIEKIEKDPEVEIILPDPPKEKPKKAVPKVKKESWTLDIQEDALEGFESDLF